MVQTIERRLDAWADAALDGVPAADIIADPQHDAHVRAFRLKRFGRCPRCDAKAIRSADDIARSGTWIRCSACSWALFCWRSLDPDALLLDIARGTSR